MYRCRCAGGVAAQTMASSSLAPSVELTASAQFVQEIECMESGAHPRGRAIDSPIRALDV
eukprot:COSAG01_NODE_11725_length_1866_cov_23.472912_1_plen_59_part_10